MCLKHMDLVTRGKPDEAKEHKRKTLDYSGGERGSNNALECCFQAWLSVFYLPLHLCLDCHLVSGSQIHELVTWGEKGPDSCTFRSCVDGGDFT